MISIHAIAHGAIPDPDASIPSPLVISFLIVMLSFSSVNNSSVLRQHHSNCRHNEDDDEINTAVYRLLTPSLTCDPTLNHSADDGPDAAGENPEDEMEPTGLDREARTHLIHRDVL